MREVEVLHDNLLAMLEPDNALTPKDIIVMLPNIALYAPSVQYLPVEKIVISRYLSCAAEKSHSGRLAQMPPAT